MGTAKLVAQFSDIPFNAADFFIDAGGASDWNVTAGQVITHRWSRIGNIGLFQLQLDAGHELILDNTVLNLLKINLPGDIASLGVFFEGMFAYNHETTVALSAWKFGRARINGGGVLDLAQYKDGLLPGWYDGAGNPSGLAFNVQLVFPILSS